MRKTANITICVSLLIFGFIVLSSREGAASQTAQPATQQAQAPKQSGEPPVQPTGQQAVQPAAQADAPPAAQPATQGAKEHPFVEANDLKPENCVKCHADVQKGKFVHTAMSSGCDTCHQAASANGKTTITDVATGGDLCAMCHELEKGPVFHGPYKAGECLVCHDPHSSDYPKATRARTDSLCFTCHGVDQPGVTVQADTKTVSVLGGQTISLDEYQKAPKIGLDPGGATGHPIMGHPLSGKVPGKKDVSLSCLSCHAPHSSTLRNLMPPGVKSDVELCAQCHQ